MSENWVKFTESRRWNMANDEPDLTVWVDRTMAKAVEENRRTLTPEHHRPSCTIKLGGWASVDVLGTIDEVLEKLGVKTPAQ